jgi:hypothetical protein
MLESLPPPLDDVEFDQAAAADAGRAASVAIIALVEATHAREVLARAALQGSEGPFAIHLADQLDQARNEAEGYRSWLETLRRQVSQAAELAGAEQLRRDAVNAERPAPVSVAPVSVAA